MAWSKGLISFPIFFLGGGAMHHLACRILVPQPVKAPSPNRWNIMKLRLYFYSNVDIQYPTPFVEKTILSPIELSW